MSNFVDQMIADINARIEAVCLKNPAASTSSAIPKNLRTRDIYSAAAALARLPKPVIGIVCRPDWVRRIERLIEDEVAKSDQLIARFCRIPVYMKIDQQEPYRIFREEAELRHYLDEKIATS